MKKISLYASSVGVALLTIHMLRTLIISKIGCAIPTILSGLCCTVPLNGALQAFGLLAAGTFLSGTAHSILAYHIPTLIAAAYWHRQVKYLEYIVPSACALLFLVHPIGVQAWGYTLFWLLPVLAVYILPASVARALTASFLAHAAGSVLWLYTVKATWVPAYWWSLMLVVPFERCAIAAGMLVVEYLQASISAWLKTFYYRTSTAHTVHN